MDAPFLEKTPRSLRRDIHSMLRHVDYHLSFDKAQSRYRGGRRFVCDGLLCQTERIRVGYESGRSHGQLAHFYNVIAADSPRRRGQREIIRRGAGDTGQRKSARGRTREWELTRRISLPTLAICCSSSSCDSLLFSYDINETGCGGNPNRALLSMLPVRSCEERLRRKLVAVTRHRDGLRQREQELQKEAAFICER